jgi:hypothetical protein
VSVGSADGRSHAVFDARELLATRSFGRPTMLSELAVPSAVHPVPSTAHATPRGQAGAGAPGAAGGADAAQGGEQSCAGELAAPRLVAFSTERGQIVSAHAGVPCAACPAGCSVLLAHECQLPFTRVDARADALLSAWLLWGMLFWLLLFRCCAEARRTRRSAAPRRGVRRVGFAPGVGSRGQHEHVD